MSETWIINENPDVATGGLGGPVNINFTSNDIEFVSIQTSQGRISPVESFIRFDDTIVFSAEVWQDQSYRTVTFETTPTGDLLTWLQANAVKQGGITDLTGWTWRANPYLTSTNIQFDVEGKVRNEDFEPYNFDYIDYNSDYGADIFAFYYLNTPEPYTPGDGFVYIPQNSLGFEEGWYFGNTGDMTSYVQVQPPVATFTGGADVTNTDLISWLQDNGTLSLLDTTMWQLNSVPDLSTDLSLSIDNSGASWNTCEYYDNGEVKIAAWLFDELQVSTNGFAYWASGVPNFLYCYNSTVFNAVISQFEAQGFTIDQSDLTSQSGYFYAERIDSTTAKLHNARRVVTRFNSDDWDNNTDFTDWLSNSAEQLDEFIIPNDVVEISLYAFSDCNSFSTITIPNSVTHIGGYAFGDCSSLTNIVIPDSVTSIGDSAFDDCSGLTSITVRSALPPSIVSNAFYNTNDCPIYVPAQSVNAYKTAWSDYANRIQAIPASGVLTVSYNNTNIIDGVSISGGVAVTYNNTTITTISEGTQTLKLIKTDNKPVVLTTPITIGDYTIPNRDSQGRQYRFLYDIIITVSSGGQWETPTISLSEDIVSTPVVDGVTKYKVYDNGEYIGYVDSDNVWHGLPLVDTPANVSASGTTLSFDEVAGAESYEVFAEDTSIGEVDA